MAENKSTALLIFTKAPVAGKVKTRLIPLLGAEKAKDLYEGLFHRTMQIALETKIESIQLWCAPDYAHAAFKKYNNYSKVSFFQQPAGDLGEKMFYAMQTALKEFDKCILIGCDCPELEANDIHEAMNILEHSNIILGPAKDGGYYLIAATEIQKDVFAHVSWGSSTVLLQTIENLEQFELSYECLRELNDVDEEDDLALLEKYDLNDILLAN